MRTDLWHGLEDSKILQQDGIKLSPKSKLIGVDPSLRSTGVVLYDPSDNCPEWFVIKSKPDGDGTVHSRVMAIMMEAIERFGPAVMVIEGYNFGKSVASGFSPVIEIGGVMKAVGGLSGWIQVPPTTWKSIVMGSRWVRAGKHTRGEKAAYLNRFYAVGGPRGINQVDAADAWMIARSVNWILLGMVPPTPGVLQIKTQIEKLAISPRML
jgi:hypothetical protein